jgi:hypothetical protein
MTQFERAVLRRLNAEAGTWDETDEGWRDLARRASTIGAIIRTLLHPPTMHEPAVPPPPPPIVQTDPDAGRRRRRDPPTESIDAAVLEHLGHAAAEASSEAEAEAFVGSMIPLAARAALAGGRGATHTLPALVRAFGQTARLLRRSPGMRPLVRTLPTVAQRTMRTIARQQQQGRPVLPAFALRILANHLRRLVSNSRNVDRVMARSHALDRRYHRGQPAMRRRPRA